MEDDEEPFKSSEEFDEQSESLSNDDEELEAADYVNTNDRDLPPPIDEDELMSNTLESEMELLSSNAPPSISQTQQQSLFDRKLRIFIYFIYFFFICSSFIFGTSRFRNVSRLC